MLKILPGLLLSLLLFGCRYEQPPQVFPASARALSLPTYTQTESASKINLPNLYWDRFTPGVDTVGWCGEVSIQMIALHYGYYHSQRAINLLGKPQHFDLYAAEIEPVMSKLGFVVDSYTNSTTAGVDDYMRWLKAQLREQHPVFSGIKRNPGGNPQWFLDHFVVFTGFDEQHLSYNSNVFGHGEITETTTALAANATPYRLTNAQNFYFGFAVRAVELIKTDVQQTLPVRLVVLAETADQVDLGVRLESLTVGQEYRLTRYQVEVNTATSQLDDAIEFTAQTDLQTFEHRQLAKHKSYFYQLTELKK